MLWNVMIRYTMNISDLKLHLISLSNSLPVLLSDLTWGFLFVKKWYIWIKTNRIWEMWTLLICIISKENYIYFCFLNLSIASMINGIFVVLVLLEYTRYMNLCDDSSESYNCLFKFKAHIKLVILYCWCCIYLLNEFFRQS